MSDFPSLGLIKSKTWKVSILDFPSLSFDYVENLESLAVHLVKKFLSYHKIQFFVCLYAV